MLQAKVILPTIDFFPDEYDATEATTALMFRRICEYMNVNPAEVDLHIEPDRIGSLKSKMPSWNGDSKYPAGLYRKETADSRTLISLNESLLRDPLGVVATLAHELGHLILLGGELLDPDSRDMEPLTDLLTVFLGLGIFTANAAARFEQHQDATTQGWSTRRLGYLSEEMYGYALAKFALDRGENEAQWTNHLSTNVKVYYKRSQSWLAKSSRS